MAGTQTSPGEFDTTTSLATMDTITHSSTNNDMIPLHPSGPDNDSDYTSDDYCEFPTTDRRPSTPRARAKKARKAAHRTRESKPLLRPAKDILSRIRHDPSLKESDFVVGYNDRHAPEIMEMDVSAWKGGGDVTDEEWIPQHRIVYFRRKGEGDEKGERVWDREKRLDRLFGSGVVPESDEDDFGRREGAGMEEVVETLSANDEQDLNSKATGEHVSQ